MALITSDRGKMSTRALFAMQVGLGPLPKTRLGAKKYYTETEVATKNNHPRFNRQPLPCRPSFVMHVFILRVSQRDSSTSKKGRLSCSKAVPFYGVHPEPHSLRTRRALFVEMCR